MRIIGSRLRVSYSGYNNSPPGAVTWDPDHADKFILGENHRIYHKWWRNGQCSPSKGNWQKLSGSLRFANGRAVTVWSANRLKLFGLNIDNEETDGLYPQWWNGSIWHHAVR